jgi:hypothetical protein
MSAGRRPACVVTYAASVDAMDIAGCTNTSTGLAASVELAISSIAAVSRALGGDELG